MRERCQECQVLESESHALSAELNTVKGDRAALLTALQGLRNCVFADRAILFDREDRDDEITYHFEGYVHDAVLYADEVLTRTYGDGGERG